MKYFFLMIFLFSHLFAQEGDPFDYFEERAQRNQEVDRDKEIILPELYRQKKALEDAIMALVRAKNGEKQAVGQIKSDALSFLAMVAIFNGAYAFYTSVMSSEGGLKNLESYKFHKTIPRLYHGPSGKVFLASQLILGGLYYTGGVYNYLKLHYSEIPRLEKDLIALKQEYEQAIIEFESR